MKWFDRYYSGFIECEIISHLIKDIILSIVGGKTIVLVQINNKTCIKAISICLEGDLKKTEAMLQSKYIGISKTCINTFL